jgi:hypothetical protein
MEASLARLAFGGQLNLIDPAGASRGPYFSGLDPIEPLPPKCSADLSCRPRLRLESTARESF